MWHQVSYCRVTDESPFLVKARSQRTEEVG